MKLTKTFVSSLILMFGSLSLSAAFIDNPRTKTVSTQVVIDGYIVTQAVRTVSVTDRNGKITTKHQIEVIVPDGAGGFTKRETRETTEASPVAGGTYTVVLTSLLIETPWTSAGSEGKASGGDPEITLSPTNFRYNVAAVDLDLPKSTTLVVTNVELEGEPFEFSPK